MTLLLRRNCRGDYTDSLGCNFATRVCKYDLAARSARKGGLLVEVLMKAKLDARSTPHPELYYTKISRYYVVKPKQKRDGRRDKGLKERKKKIYK